MGNSSNKAYNQSAPPQRTTPKQPRKTILLFSSVKTIPPPPQSEENSHSVLPVQVPTLGVKVRFLQEFLTACPTGDNSVQNYSTSDVCNKVIKPFTKPYNLSLCEILRQSKHPSIGPATVFISHAWLSSFTSLVTALENHFTAKLDTFVWIDIFSLNQNSLEAQAAPEGGGEEWLNSMGDMIKRIGHTVSVLVRFQDPIPLRRTWCLWEMYTTIAHGGRLELAFLISDKSYVVDEVMKDVEGLLLKLRAWINVDGSECTLPSDQTRIISSVLKDMKRRRNKAISLSSIDEEEAHVHDAVLYHEYREAIIQCLRKAIAIQFLAKLYRAAFNAHGSNYPPLINLSYCLAMQFCLLQEYSKAEPFLVFCLEKDKKLLGDYHQMTLSTMRNLALVNKDQEKYDEALSLYGTCYERCVVRFAADSTVTQEVKKCYDILKDAILTYEGDKKKIAQALIDGNFDENYVKRGEFHPIKVLSSSTTPVSKSESSPAVPSSTTPKVPLQEVQALSLKSTAQPVTSTQV